MAFNNGVKATIILRHDTALNWREKNPILAEGEISAEIDTGLLKLGNGILPYNDLNYINEGISGSIYDVTESYDQYLVFDCGTATSLID